MNRREGDLIVRERGRGDLSKEEEEGEEKGGCGHNEGVRLGRVERGREKEELPPSFMVWDQ